MARADLLALTADDLAVLTNRGTVKRARRELEAGECTAEVREDEDGTVTARWSDGVECRLPGGAAVRQGRCSCLTPHLCRHLVRTVLAYQRQAAAAGLAADAPAVGEAHGPWDPGSIADADLARHFRPASLTKAQSLFAQGTLVELVRSRKPTAHFHQEACTLRFLVPGDLRYTYCDCGVPAPCGHVPLAVWAFRLLPADQSAGVVASVATVDAAPADLLDDLEAALLELAEQGVAGTVAAWRDRMARLEARCRQADLVWPAEILAELVHETERYEQRDASFGPERVAELVGELLIRSDALRRPTGAVPPLLVRGTARDGVGTLGAARLVGLGCGVRRSRRAVTLSAYFQEADSGGVVAVQREFAQPADAEPRAFADLALTPAVRGCPYAALGVGQLLLQGGKRSASRRLLPSRARASVQPQAFAWEGLRAPVLAEEFAELRARLGALPPASLRPRRVADDFHVCAVTGAEAVEFEPATQTVRAVLRDGRGDRAGLEHPYTSQGRSGAEALLTALGRSAGELRFVSGTVRATARGLVVHPVCLVFQQGATRTAVQPWVERTDPSLPAVGLPEAVAGAVRDPLTDYLSALSAALGELFLLGLLRSDAGAGRAWGELRDRGEGLGMARLTVPVAELTSALEQRDTTLHWQAGPAARVALRLAVLARLAQDLAHSAGWAEE